jgi:crotonobetainyl-CoA:carnitine CoA-transferase CaiB-like acyl-CoA transferase
MQKIFSLFRSRQLADMGVDVIKVELCWLLRSSAQFFVNLGKNFVNQ